MARYIDADWIYQMVENRYRVSSGIEHRCERDLLDLICQAPTADVVPKSEVAREIFDKVDEIGYRYLNDADYSGGDMIYDLNELKKKYMEGKE